MILSTDLVSRRSLAAWRFSVVHSMRQLSAAHQHDRESSIATATVYVHMVCMYVSMFSGRNFQGPKASTSRRLCRQSLRNKKKKKQWSFIDYTSSHQHLVDKVMPPHALTAATPHSSLSHQYLLTIVRLTK